MLHSSNQVPPSVIPNTSTTTTTVSSMPQIPINDNIWTQPKPSNPMVQPHSFPGMLLIYK